MTALAWSIAAKSDAATALLLEKGADVNAASKVNSVCVVRAYDSMMLKMIVSVMFSGGKNGIDDWYRGAE